MLLYRIVDTMVDNYRPEVDKLSERLDELEEEVFENPNTQLARRILNFKKDISSLRQVVLPQRDVVGRLARREFPLINEQLAYGFRDVHDHLVRLSDEAMFFQDRITSILDAHLSAVSNQLNQVMKVLTIIATLFMPLTVLDRHVRHERAAAASSRRRTRAVLVDCRDHVRDVGGDAGLFQTERVDLSNDQ